MAKPRIGFELDPGVVAALARSKEMGDLTLAQARAVADKAREIAPVDTGAYRASIRAEPVTSRRRTRYARVVADDPKAAWVEFGTSRHRARAPLRRATEAVFGELAPES